jgi:signal transduction histidine kinase
MQDWGIGLKLKSKIYIFQILFALTLLSFLFFTYKSYEKRYHEDLKEYICEITNIYKKQFLNSYNQAKFRFKEQKRLFVKMHKVAIKYLKENPKLDLHQLAKRLKKEFGLQDVLVDIFLIDKDYVIFKTTFPKDLGLDLSLIKDAKYYLDEAYKNKDKIYVADFVSTDALNMEYRLYSYAYFKDDIFLELGFLDKGIYNSFKYFMLQNKDSSTKLYPIIIKDNRYNYYQFSAKRVALKKDFFKYIKKVPVEQKEVDNVIKSFKLKDKIVEYRENFAIVTTPLFSTDMYDKIGYNNIILEIKIDISSKLNTLQKFKNIFYISIIITLVLLILIFFALKYNFTKPIDRIIKSIDNKKLIEDESILNKGDEFSTIAKRYNMLLISLNKELELNKRLLEENRRFIANTVHQIRTPLTNIMMNIELMVRNELKNKNSDYIEQINASINMLTNSYEDLSYIISKDSIEYHKSRVSLSNILKERVKFFETLAKVNFKKIVADIQERIFYDINRIELERLIDNNISNAIKYAKPNHEIEVRLYKDDEKIVMEFLSYGKKIKEPESLFEKNYRENESMRGLGLGLFMVKNICNKYGIRYSVTYSNEQNIFRYVF